MISARDFRIWTPPCPLPPKLVLAPAGSAPRPDVSFSCHRAVLRVRFPAAPLSINFPVPQETHSWSGRLPTTQAQCTALVIANIMKFPDAGDGRATDVLAVDSTF